MHAFLNELGNLVREDWGFLIVCVAWFGLFGFCGKTVVLYWFYGGNKEKAAANAKGTRILKMMGQVFFWLVVAQAAVGGLAILIDSRSPTTASSAQARVVRPPSPTSGEAQEEKSSGVR